MTAPTFVATSGASGNRTPHNCTVPAAAQAGDLLIASSVLISGGALDARTPPTGWTELVNEYAGGYCQHVVFMRVADATDPGKTYSWFGVDFRPVATEILVYRGVDSVTAPVAPGAAASGGSVIAPSGSTTEPDTLILYLYQSANTAGSTSLTVPPSLTSRRQGARLCNGSNYVSAALGDTVQATPGTVGALSASATGNNGLVAAPLLLAPPPSSDVSGTLAATIPGMTSVMAGETTPPAVDGSVAATLAPPLASITGSAADPAGATSGTLVASLPALTGSIQASTPQRNGLGLALDSSAVLTVDAPLEPEPPLPPGTPPTVLHVIAPTVPVPTLVNGRPS